MSRRESAFLLIVIVAMGCTPGLNRKPETCERLARQLKIRGILWEEQRLLPKPNLPGRAWDESVELTGGGYQLTIYRVEEWQTYERIYESEKGGKPPVERYPPFIVVIRKEPTAGQVATALKELLGEE